MNPSVWQFMVAPSLNPTLPLDPSPQYLAERYFRPTPLDKDKYLAVALLDVGAAFTVSCALLAAGSSATFLIGVAIGLLGFFVGWFRLEEYGRQFNWAEPKASDTQMDTWLSEQLMDIEEEAMSRLAITPDELDGTARGAVGFVPWHSGPYLLEPSRVGPFTVFGPLLEPKVHWVGDDGVWRFRSYEVMVLCPTTRCVGIYECVLNTVTGKRSKIELREYDYSDIVVLSLVDRPTGTQSCLADSRRCTDVRRRKSTAARIADRGGQWRPQQDPRRDRLPGRLGAAATVRTGELRPVHTAPVENKAEDRIASRRPRTLTGS